MTRRFKLDSLIGGLFCFAFAAWLLHQTLQLDVEAAARVGGGIGAADYPTILAVTALMLSLVLILQGLFARFAEEVDGDETAPGMASDAEQSYLRPTLAFATLVLYALLFEPAGYLVVTPVALVALMRITGERRWTLAVVSAVCWTIALFLLFRFGVNLVLPEGLLADLGIVI